MDDDTISIQLNKGDARSDQANLLPSRVDSLPPKVPRGERVSLPKHCTQRPDGKLVMPDGVGGRTEIKTVDKTMPLGVLRAAVWYHKQEVHVKLLAAAKLPGKAMDGFISSFVVCHTVDEAAAPGSPKPNSPRTPSRKLSGIPKHHCRTETKKHDVNPEWPNFTQTTFMSENDLQTKMLELQVWWARSLQPNKMIGRVLIDLSTIPAGEDINYRQAIRWYGICPPGSSTAYSAERTLEDVVPKEEKPVPSPRLNGRKGRRKVSCAADGHVLSAQERKMSPGMKMESLNGGMADLSLDSGAGEKKQERKSSKSRSRNGSRPPSRKRSSVLKEWNLRIKGARALADGTVEMPDGFGSWMPLQRGDGKAVHHEDDMSLGAARVAVRYNSQKGKLLITVFELRSLPAANAQGTCDPYVKIYLLPEQKKRIKLKTGRRKSNADPTFNENFMLMIPAEELDGRTLDVAVWESQVLSRNYAIAHFLIPLSDVVKDSSEQSAAKWYLLEPTNDAHGKQAARYLASPNISGRTRLSPPAADL